MFGFVWTDEAGGSAVLEALRRRQYSMHVRTIWEVKSRRSTCRPSLAGVSVALRLPVWGVSTSSQLISHLRSVIVPATVGASSRRREARVSALVLASAAASFSRVQCSSLESGWLALPLRVAFNVAASSSTVSH